MIKADKRLFPCTPAGYIQHPIQRPKMWLFKLSRSHIPLVNALGPNATGTMKEREAFAPKHHRCGPQTVRYYAHLANPQQSAGGGSWRCCARDEYGEDAALPQKQHPRSVYHILDILHGCFGRHVEPRPLTLGTIEPNTVRMHWRAY